MTSDRNLEAAREAALAWHVRLNAPDAQEADWLAFEEWVAEPVHGEAYRRIEDLWLALDAPTAEVVALQPRRRAPRFSWGVGIAASLVIAVFATGSVVALRASRAEPSMTFAAAADAPRDVKLADGTRLRLNRGARVEVRLDRGSRHVDMSAGEVAYDVAHDPTRPFTITAGDRQVRVVGTEFDIVRTTDRFDIAVRRGVVEVRAAQALAQTAPIAGLTAGAALHHSTGSTTDAVSATNPDAAFAWTEGRLVYVDAPVSTVAADFNRYGARSLRVSADARSVRITATLEIDTPEAMLRRLKAFAPIEVTHVRDHDELSLRRSR